MRVGHSSVALKHRKYAGRGTEWVTETGTIRMYDSGASRKLGRFGNEDGVFVASIDNSLSFMRRSSITGLYVRVGES